VRHQGRRLVGRGLRRDEARVALARVPEAPAGRRARGARRAVHPRRRPRAAPPGAARRDRRDAQGAGEDAGRALPGGTVLLRAAGDVRAEGRPVWTGIRRFQGATEVGLSALGRAQAAALGRAVRGYRVAGAYVSPMRRALETAEIALRGTGIPVVPLPDLRELSLGEWEGRTVDEIRRSPGDPYLAWLRAPEHCA